MDPSNDDEPDEDTLKAFTKLLERIGPTWLDKLRPKEAHTGGSSPSPKTEAGSDPLSSFLRETLTKTEKANEKLMEQLEKIRDILTPEQLTLLRSPPAAPKNEDGGSGQPSNGKPQKTDTPAAKPKSRWL